jgi:hypothetical protein
MSLRRALLPLSLALVACGDSREPAQGIARPNTRVLSADGRAALISLEADGRVILDANEETLALAEGQILASEPAAAAPYGMLRRINAVTRVGDTVVLDTREAAPHEALKEANISLRGALEAGNIAARPDALGINLPFEKVLWDADDDESTTDDQLKVSALFKLDAGFGIDYQVFDEDALFDDLNPFDAVDPSVSAFFGLDQRAEVSLVIPDEVTGISIRETLYATTFEPITVMAGPVPLVFVPFLEVDARVEAAIGSGARTYGAQQSITGSVAFACDLDGCSDRSTAPGADFTSNLPTIDEWLQARSEVHLIPRFSLLLYGAAGLYGQLDASASLEVTPLQAPAWNVSAGLQCEVGLTAFGFDWGASVCDVDWTLLEAENEPPQVHLGHPTGWLIKGAPVALSPWAFDPERGKLPVTLSDSLGGFPPTVVEPGSALSVALDVGAHVITATATDEAGETTVTQVTVVITDPAPEVTIHAPFDEAELLTGYAVALRGTAIDGFAQGGALPCNALTWSSSNPSDVLPANVCGANSEGFLFATFMTPGPRTLTLSANDGTSVSAESVKVDVVNPAPGQLQVQLLSPMPEDGTFSAHDDLVSLSFLAVGSRSDVAYRWAAASCSAPLTGCAPEMTVATGSFDAVTNGTRIDDTWSMNATVGPTANTDHTKLTLYVDGVLVDTLDIERVVIK